MSQCLGYGIMGNPDTPTLSLKLFIHKWHCAQTHSNTQTHTQTHTHTDSHRWDVSVSVTHKHHREPDDPRMKTCCYLPLNTLLFGFTIWHPPPPFSRGTRKWLLVIPPHQVQLTVWRLFLTIRLFKIHSVVIMCFLPDDNE